MKYIHDAFRSLSINQNKPSIIKPTADDIGKAPIFLILIYCNYIMILVTWFQMPQSIVINIYFQ